MPGGDGTGPAGMGPMTGRAAGYCAGYRVPGYANPVGGRRPFGFGRGAGRGFRNRYYATGVPGWRRAPYGWDAPQGYYAQPDSQEEMQFLRDQADFLKKQLEDVQNRISTLESNSDSGEEE